MEQYDRSLRTGIRSGIVVIVVLLAAEVLRRFQLLDYPSYLFYSVYEGLIVLQFIAMSVHVWVYRKIGEKFQAKAIGHGATFLSIAILPLGAALLWSVAAGAYDATAMQRQIIDGWVGLALTVYIIAAIVFAGALLLNHRKVGVSGIVASSIVLYALYFWYPVLVALAVGLSVLYFRREQQMI